MKVSELSAGIWSLALSYSLEYAGSSVSVTQVVFGRRLTGMLTGRTIKATWSTVNAHYTFCFQKAKCFPSPTEMHKISLRSQYTVVTSKSSLGSILEQPLSTHCTNWSSPSFTTWPQSKSSLKLQVLRLSFTHFYFLLFLFCSCELWQPCRTDQWNIQLC